MSPLNPDSFWANHLAPTFSENSNALPTQLVRATGELFASWKKKYFQKTHEVVAHYEKPYFIGTGLLRSTAGIIQVKDYAIAVDDKELLGGYSEVQKLLKDTKTSFYDLLLDSKGLNYFGMPKSLAKPLHQEPKQVSISKFDKILERRLALAGLLVKELANDPNFGRTKFAKIFYLADADQGLDLDTTYYREAAGPLDPRAFYNKKFGIESLGQANKYFTVDSSGKRVKYTPAEKLDTLLSRAENILGKRLSAVKRIIEECRKLDTDQCEIISTLHACWNDLLLEDTNPTDESIVKEFFNNWHHKKRRFPRERLFKALDWMRRHKIVARGIGRHTATKPQFEDDSF